MSNPVVTGNPVVRWQLISPSPDASTRFMRSLFGWEVSRDNAMGYREIDTGAGGLAGGVWPGPTEQPPFVQLFVAVPDVAACVEQATTLGAKVVVPRTVLPDGDTMAVIVDPTGLSIGICTLRERASE